MGTVGSQIFDGALHILNHGSAVKLAHRYVR